MEYDVGTTDAYHERGSQLATPSSHDEKDGVERRQGGITDSRSGN